jgi:hypothetical protein
VSCVLQRGTDITFFFLQKAHTTPRGVGEGKCGGGGGGKRATGGCGGGGAEREGHAKGVCNIIYIYIYYYYYLCVCVCVCVCVHNFIIDRECVSVGV